MYLTGPNAGYGSDYWTEGWVGGSGGPSSTDHSMTVGFQYDSDYDLSVFACASDDNGSQCSSDTVHFHTPPESAAGDWPGEGMICSVGPCPYITSIDPRPIFYYPGSGSFTVYGGNLQNLAGAWITYPTVYWNIDSSEGVSLSIVSASNDQATISYTVNPSYAGGVCASPGMACHNWELWVIGPNSDQYHLPVFPYRSY